MIFKNCGKSLNSYALDVAQINQKTSNRTNLSD